MIRWRPKYWWTCSLIFFTDLLYVLEFLPFIRYNNYLVTGNYGSCTWGKHWDDWHPLFLNYHWKITQWTKQRKERVHSLAQNKKKRLIFLLFTKKLTQKFLDKFLDKRNYCVIKQKINLMLKLKIRDRKHSDLSRSCYDSLTFPWKTAVQTFLMWIAIKECKVDPLSTHTTKQLDSPPHPAL